MAQMKVFVSHSHEDNAFCRALAIDPNNAAAWSGKSKALRFLGRKREAEEAERRAKALGG
jgi:Flp pilus assembly protein TadD